MKYSVGDKVIIVSKPPKRNWNPLMNKYCGTEMTIRKLDRSDYDGVAGYRMEEDYGESRGKGWFWDNSMIECLAEIRKEEDIAINKEEILNILSN